MRFRLILVFVALAASLSPAHGQASRISIEQQGIAYVEVLYPSPESETCTTKIRKPLRSRLRGRIEVVQTGDGRLSVINTLSFSEYLQGLAEVPRSWPQAALEAQVIAARSYALYHRAHPRASARSLGYDICATDACQVYRGAAVEQGAFGERWVSAVGVTRGKVLAVGGEPVQAFYHSTSSGRTKPHFDGGSPQPYLASVSGEDADSPLARWSVHIPFSDLETILTRYGAWPGGRIDRVVRTGDVVAIDGGGKHARPPAPLFRRALNVEAPCAFPGKYPPERADGGRLPSTVLRPDFSIAAEPGGIAVFGRGWGHDVGMSQYGARSLATRGRSADEILAHFYNGTRPATVEEPPSIRVLVAEGATNIIVAPEQGASVSGTPVDDGAAIEITPAEGGPRTNRRPVPSPHVLEIEDDGITVESGRVEQTIVLTTPSRISVDVSGPGGNVKTAETSYERGTQTLTVIEPGNPSLPAGSYRMVVNGYDGLDRGRLEKRFNFVPAATMAAPTPAPRPAPDPTRRPLWPVAAAVGLALVLGFGLARGFRRRA